MPVKCGDVAAMLHHDGPAIAVHEICELDCTIGGSNDAGTVFGGDVHAAMERAFTIEWVNAFTEGPADMSLNRPQGRGSGHAQPVMNGGGIAQSSSDPDGGRPTHGGVLQFIKLPDAGLRRVVFFKRRVGLEAIED